jgi:F-type H+-transporting ATPase subunit a
MEIHASLKAEDLFVFGPVAITNSMVMTWLAMALLVFIARRVSQDLRVVPSGLQSVVEYTLQFLLNLVEGSGSGKAGRRFFPLIATIFLFIITANYMALFPGVGTVWKGNPHVRQPFSYAVANLPQATTEAADARLTPPQEPSASAKAAGEQDEPATVYLLRAANADLNMTLGMGIIAFVFIHWSGVRAHGVKGYLEELGTPLFLTPVKLMIEGFVPISLSMRLFGNVFGGEMLMAVMNFPVVAIPFIVMELLFGFIQALLFAMLTLIFTILATTLTPGHGGGHNDHGHGGEHGSH